MISTYLFLLLFPTIALGVEIVKSPDEHIWVEMGEEKSLVCTTDTGWQWCQWEHTDLNGQESKYQIGQKYNALDTWVHLITFTELTETNCGIRISTADPVRHEVMKNHTILFEFD